LGLEKLGTLADYPAETQSPAFSMSRREIELKLEVPAHGLARLGRSSLLKGATTASRKPATLVSVYFDTDKLKLRNKGFSLRVRRIGRRHVQTIKQHASEDSPLFVRNEWEREIGSTQPDLDFAQDPALELLLNKKLRRDLKPVFETHVRRTVYPIESDGSEIELTIDRGKLEAGRHSVPICEIELELKSGQSAELFKIARTLAKEIPLQLVVKSKAERGYAVLTGEKLKGVKAARVALSPDISRQVAFQLIARACLYQLAANQPAMQGGDPEGVHQMRVALRRLRAAISLFSEMLASPQTAAVKAEFKWIARELGPVRELDVFIKRVLKPVSDGNPNGAGVAVLARDLQKQRGNAFARALAAVESPRFRALVLDAAAWIEAGEWTHQDNALVRALRERPIAPAAAEELHRRWKRILKRGKDLETLGPQRRHKLRIQAKKLRYASEYFTETFPGKKSARRCKRFVFSLEKLQDALGDLNDIAVHEDTIAALGLRRRRANPKRAFAAGLLTGREDAQLDAVMAAATAAGAALISAKSFWR